MVERLAGYQDQGKAAEATAQRGNIGDVETVGHGVYEMREHFGPGWRMYYVMRGDTMIVLLAGGKKTSQACDIAAARRLAATLEDEDEGKRQNQGKFTR